MKLSAPKVVTFLISFILGVVSSLFTLIPKLTQLIPPVLLPYVDYFLPVAFVLLVLACLFKGL